PTPGGPIMTRACPPAAATSSARLAPSWPATRSREGPRGWLGLARARAGGGAGPPRRKVATSFRWRKARAGSPARAASGPLASGTTTAWTCPLRASAAARTPLTGRRVPSSPSSPRKPWPRARSGEPTPMATRMPAAMGRSKRGPSLRRPAGARLMVTRPRGISKPLFRKAARTRFRLSKTAVPGRPITSKAGRPGRRSTSTWTGWPSTPARAALHRRASTRKTPLPRRARGPGCLFLSPPPSPFLPASDPAAQVSLPNLGIPLELVGHPLQHQPARLQHIASLGHMEGQAGVLLHQEDGHPLPVDGLDGAEDLHHQLGSEAEGWLIQEQEPGRGHESPADGQHLLLSAREGAGQLVPPLLQPGEELVHPVPPLGKGVAVPPPGVAAQVQVLLAGEGGQDLPSFGHVRHPPLHQRVGGEPGHLLSAQPDLAPGPVARSRGTISSASTWGLRRRSAATGAQRTVRCLAGGGAMRSEPSGPAGRGTRRPPGAGAARPKGSPGQGSGPGPRRRPHRR